MCVRKQSEWGIAGVVGEVGEVGGNAEPLDACGRPAVLAVARRSHRTRCFEVTNLTHVTNTERTERKAAGGVEQCVGSVRKTVLPSKCLPGYQKS